ncbi:hypothetical protein AMATHDRAFT_3537 [Amanita thiersii Skay4041]|uniref:RING-type domain-containing protein n=1 Tax=Amanita thiersii Skay4041 TaxID=703135 RepID=A0A2A9NRL8_9AGAR|nr:hypothetical protein AMATHDRAFT_3537 [Amanita thiersii Skay4041]
MAQHIFGYSKSVRAKCHGPPPCNGSSMPIGTLRYGRITSSELGNNVEWCHWGCVSSNTLRQLAISDLEQAEGFQELRTTDKQKIRTAIARGRIDPADIPETTKASLSAPSAAPASSSKRKRDEVVPSASQSGNLSTVNPHDNKEDDEDAQEEEDVRHVLYFTFKSSVVGIQYYTGLVGSGEEVLLVREPQNPYDRNAIQVLNISRIQVGHIPRKVAANLSPLLERRAISVEGVINDGNLTGRRGYNLSLTLKLYGPADKRDELEPSLRWATSSQHGSPKKSTAIPSTSLAVGLPGSSQCGDRAPRMSAEEITKAAELSQILNNMTKIDDAGRRSSMLDSLCFIEDILDLPVHPNPPSRKTGELLSDLLKHQSQALQWCIRREYPVLPKKESDKPSIISDATQKVYYYNVATNTPQVQAPILGRGSICADAMGLGKTLTMLSLIIATKDDNPSDYSKTSLIVAPLSVLSNWEQQIPEHCAPGSLTYIVYYDVNRSLSAEELMKYDVVITTYDVLSGEYSDTTRDSSGPSKKRKKNSTLFDVQWKRIILDEGHIIRNPASKKTKAVCSLNAQRRWVLSGTPIINSPRDLGSLLTFLKICQPLDNEEFFKRLLLRPLKQGLATGVELLRVTFTSFTHTEKTIDWVKALMSQICIRRTKEMQDNHGNQLVTLPPVEMIRISVSLSDEARVGDPEIYCPVLIHPQQLYDEVEAISRSRFKALMAHHGRTNNTCQTNVVVMLTRLRQLALHPGLIPANYIEILKKENSGNSASPVIVNPKERLRLQGVLARTIEDCEECPICMNILDNPRITSCAHIFCLPCITESIFRDPRCPMDRRSINMNDLYEPAPPSEYTQCFETPEEDDRTGIRGRPSAKIEQLIHLLKLLPSTEKSLVFSQFTSFLDLIGQALEEEGMPYLRFDGQTSKKRRDEVLGRFTVPVESPGDAERAAERRDSSGRTRRQGTQYTSTRKKQVENDGDESLTESDPEFIPTNLVADLTDDESDFSELREIRSRAKGKKKARDARGTTCTDGNPRILLLALKAGSLGLNLTVANNVFFWWQEGIESQAVDRVNRMGQQKNVRVYQLIAEDTVEAKVLEIQERKNALIKQAFSGMKGKETERQRQEAKLQG